MAITVKNEKRIHSRVSKNLPIKIKNDDFDIVAETMNISCSGVYCQIDKYIPLLTKIKATILLPSKIKNNPEYINCKGVIVRIEKENNALEDQYRIAIYFNEISKANIFKINRFIKTQTAQLTL